MATETDSTTETDTEINPQAETAADKSVSDKRTKDLEAEAERLRTALKETNRKAAADRKRLEDIDNEAKERENAKLGESERLKKQLKELEDQKREAEQRATKLEADLLERRIDTEIERYAIAHFNHPELASRLVDRDRITYDPEADKVTGIREAVEAVLKKYPTLGGAQRGGGSPQAMRPKQPGGAGGGGDKQVDLRTEFAKMGGYEQL
jgi:chromosome segregation ATPase